jgi:hypothetical protein
MKLTLKRLTEMDGALSKVLAEPVDFKLAYRIRKIANKILTELKNAEQARQDLIKKHGTKDDKGRVKVEDKDVEAFKKDYDDLMAIEVDLGVSKIPYECLTGLKISAYELAVIEDLVDDPKEVSPSGEEKGR